MARWPPLPVTTAPLKLWQRNSYLLRPLEGHQDTVWSIAVSPDSKNGVASLAAGGGA